jgi:hypothetical protein
MRVDTAISLIDTMVYKPGWTFEATENNRFESAVTVLVNYPANNSDRDNAMRGYIDAVMPTARASFPLLVDPCDDVDLYQMMIEIIMHIELHEAREFLRVRPSYWAPFHPHRLDGMKRWSAVEKRGQMWQQMPLADLQFGIA